MKNSIILEVLDASSIGECRRMAVHHAELSGLDEQTRAKIAIVITEMASNQLKHAENGEIILIPSLSQRRLDIFALDRGPGMENAYACMADGYSSKGTFGGGLGAMKRLAQEFDIHSRVEIGTAVYCAFYSIKNEVPGLLEHANLNLPYPGETVSGDGIAADFSSQSSSFLIVDGLGHGLEAHRAAEAALDVFYANSMHDPARILEKAHPILSKTRGATVGLAQIDHRSNILQFAGIGNISGLICNLDQTYTLMGIDGILGHNARKFQNVSYPWTSASVLTMRSDGIMNRCRLDNYSGLISRHPKLIAAVLMRDGRRRSDDASILVAKTKESVRGNQW